MAASVERSTIELKVNQISFQPHFKKLSSLTHNNIDRYLTYESTAGNLCRITVEEGKGKFLGSLKSYISDRGTKKLDEIPNILWSITSGLEHLHQKDIVHGRLCLANVSVFKRGSETMVKLSNYGLQQWEVTGQEITVEKNLKSLTDDMLDFGNLCQHVLDHMELDNPKKMKVENVKCDAMTMALDLVEVLKDEDADNRPDSSLLLFHPYFTLKSEDAKEKLHEHWKSQKKELFRQYFTSEQFEGWSSSLSDDDKKIIESEREERYLFIDVDEGNFNLTKTIRTSPWSFAHFQWHIMKIIHAMPKFYRNENEKLGEGGYGQVFAGTMEKGKLSYRAAFKKPILGSSRDYDRESRIKDLDHPFVVKFYGFHREETIVWLVMERCDGDLEKYVTRGLPSIKHGSVDHKLILVQLSIGLAYLHKNGIVHRDLKPQNILLHRIIETNENVIVKISDFGLSKQYHRTPEGQVEISKTKGNKGTSGYKAPELLNASGDIEPKSESDVWALGLIIYFVLTDGKHPFGEQIPTEAGIDLREFFIKKLKTLRIIGPLSHDWAASDLVLQLLEYQPEKRPKAFLIVYHPFFSLTNKTTKLFLAKQLIDSRATESFAVCYVGSIQKWYCSIEADSLKSDDEDTKTLLELKWIESYVDADPKVQAIFNDLRSGRPSELQSDLQQQLDADSQELMKMDSEKDNVNSRFVKLMNWLDVAPRLFGSYFWFVLKSVDWEAAGRSDQFSVSAMMTFTVFSEHDDDLNELWRTQKVVNDEDSSCIIMATMASKNHTLKFLLEKKYCDLGRICIEDQSLLHIAAESSSMTVIQLLLDHGAVATAVDESGKTPLHKAAASNKNGDVVRLLIERGTSPAAVDKFMSTPVHLAASSNGIEVIKALIENGASVQAVDKDGKTPLHKAAATNNIDVIEFLIAHGASLMAVDKYKRTLLHEAARSNSVEVIKFFLEKGLLATETDKGKRTALHYAVQGKHLEVVRFLQEEIGLSVTARDSFNQTPLHHAARCNSVKIIQFLLEKGASATDVDRYQQSSLHKAASWNNFEVIRLLVENNASATEQDQYNQTPLHKAARLNKIEIIKFLIEKGASAETVDNYGQTPLHKAAGWNSLNVIKFLFESGAPLTTVDNNGKSPLHEAARSNSVEVVQFLLVNGASVSATDHCGRTPLHEAACFNSIEVIQVLLDHNAVATAADINGNTPLAVAAIWKRDPQIISILDVHGSSA